MSQLRVTETDESDSESGDVGFQCINFRTTSSLVLRNGCQKHGWFRNWVYSKINKSQSGPSCLSHSHFPVLSVFVWFLSTFKMPVLCVDHVCSLGLSGSSALPQPVHEENTWWRERAWDCVSARKPYASRRRSVSLPLRPQGRNPFEMTGSKSCLVKRNHVRICFLMDCEKSHTIL